MTITLDDMFSLLHILIVRQFCSYITLDVTMITQVLEEMLRVECGDAFIETRQC